MAVFEAIERVKELAKTESHENPALHSEILEAIHGLQLDVESPSDTLFRVRFQVSVDQERKDTEAVRTMAKRSTAAAEHCGVDCAGVRHSSNCRE